jgi:O-antigen/teichoic acid export membrane protein
MPPGRTGVPRLRSGRRTLTVHPRKFIRDALGILLSQYLTRALVLVRGLVAAVTLGPFGFGGWNALNLIYDYGSYASAGALQGLDLELPATVARGEAAAARALMSGAVTAALLGGLAFAILVGADLAFGGRAFTTLGGVGLPVLMLIVSLLQLVFQYLASALRAHGRFHAVSLAGSLQALVGCALGIAMVTRWGAWGLLWGWLAGTLIALAAMRRAIPEAPLSPGPLDRARELVRAGFPIFAYFAITLLLRSADRLALVRFAAPDALGLYSLGIMAAGLVVYVPEAAAFVLFPRVAAAGRGAGDPAAVVAQSIRAHRAVTVVVPFLVGTALLWADPVVARLLPHYREGVTALKALCIGALMLSAATIPGYVLLAGPRRGALVRGGAIAAALSAMAVFAVAALTRRPLPVAIAEASGCALFAIVVILHVAEEWRGEERGRAGWVIASVVPALWAGALSLALDRVGERATWSAAIAQSFLFELGYLPVLFVLGRGIGLVGLVREWRDARSARA